MAILFFNIHQTVSKIRRSIIDQFYVRYPETRIYGRSLFAHEKWRLRRNELLLELLIDEKVYLFSRVVEAVARGDEIFFLKSVQRVADGAIG